MECPGLRRGDQRDRHDRSFGASFVTFVASERPSMPFVCSPLDALCLLLAFLKALGEKEPRSDLNSVEPYSQ